MVKKIYGVAIAPGVSRNGRLYTAENLQKAYARAKARISEDKNPIVMRTHHGAGDDSLRIVAKVTDVSLTKEGAIAYEAVPAQTAASKDITALMEGQDKALAHVSVFGSWVGSPRYVKQDGAFVETADDLEIDKIDFTATPGVLDATAKVTEFDASTEPGVIAESMRPVMFADASPISEYADADAATSRLSVNLCGYVNGFDISIGAWGVPSDQIDAAADTAQRAAQAAIAILQAGPVDDDGDGESIDDNAMETKTPDTSVVAESGKEPVMGDNQKPEEGTEAVAETAAPEKPLTATDVTSAVTEALKAAGVIKVEETTDGGDAAAAAETKAEEKPVAETAPVDIKALSESIRQEIVAGLVKEGVIKPTRRGRGLSENTEASAESSAEAWENRGEDLAAAFAAEFNAQD